MKEGKAGGDRTGLSNPLRNGRYTVQVKTGNCKMTSFLVDRKNIK
jgi:hypothetical protein